LCRTAAPALREVAPGQLAACHYPVDGTDEVSAASAPIAVSH